jgi:hypothetical protein
VLDVERIDVVASGTEPDVAAVEVEAERAGGGGADGGRDEPDDVRAVDLAGDPGTLAAPEKLNRSESSSSFEKASMAYLDSPTSLPSK